MFFSENPNDTPNLFLWYEMCLCSTRVTDYGYRLCQQGSEWRRQTENFCAGKIRTWTQNGEFKVERNLRSCQYAGEIKEKNHKKFALTPINVWNPTLPSLLKRNLFHDFPFRNIGAFTVRHLLYASNDQWGNNCKIVRDASAWIKVLSQFYLYLYLLFATYCLLLTVCYCMLFAICMRCFISDCYMFKVRAYDQHQTSRDKEVLSLRQQLVDFQAQSDEKTVIGNKHQPQQK